MDATWPEARQQRLVVNLCVAVALALAGLAVVDGRTTMSPVLLFGEEDAPPKALPWSLPYGKGMWTWQVSRTEGGDAEAIVERAQSTGLTHVYVRTGSSWDGFTNATFLNRILPAAHDAGIRVYGWDFPRLISVPDDVARATEAVTYRTPSGHRLDGFAADIETAAEGTRISAEAATAYGRGLRESVGNQVPLIAVVPRPSPVRRSYPYAEVVSQFDAIAPMVYWLNREPGSDVTGVMRDLRSFGKPIFPIGQAYDGSPEGGRRGVPPRAELLRFTTVAHQQGAAGVSFWSWQAADKEAWAAIRDAPEFRVRRPE